MSDRSDERAVKGYALVLTVAGPNYRDDIEVSGKTIEELVPEAVEQNGMTFERYVDAASGEYIEVRFDYIVARRLMIEYELTEEEAFESTSGIDDDSASEQIRRLMEGR